VSAERERIAELCAECADAWKPGRHDTSDLPPTPDNHIEQMRRWLAAGNGSWNLPLVLDVRDSWGFPYADEYEALLVAEAQHAASRAVNDPPEKP
jgi:hypothetical protein